MPNLTKSIVDKAAPKEKDYIIWDSKLSGFGVKITPKGRKTYLYKYRSEDGRQRKPAIGVHGGVTCEQAREIARGWSGEIAKGHDPLDKKRNVKESPTISEFADRYFKEHVMVYNKKSTQDLTKIYIEKYIKPLLGTRKVIALTKEDIMKVHYAMKETPTQANRLLGTLSKMMSLAETWGLRNEHTNPVLGVQKYKEDRRERYLSNEELKRLFKVLDKHEKGGTESIYFISLVRLLLLTGARLSEIKNARWEWIDEINAVLRLPDSKTGKKTIHLSPAAFEVLRSVPKVEGNPFIIVGGVEGKHLDNAQKPWRRVRKEAKIEDVRIHDLRHTYASICVGQGMSLQMVAKLLGHSQTRTSERYAHLANDPVRTAATQAGDSISNLMPERQRRVND